MPDRSTLIRTSAGVVVGALLLVGCSDGAGRPAALPVTPAPTVGPTQLPSPAASPSEAAAPSPEPSPSRTRPAPPSYDVAAVQRRLTELKYYVGPVNARRGPALRSAVMAFQKIHGLPVDGAVGAATLAALAKPVTPVLRAKSPAHRVEIDLTKQVMYVVDGGVLRRILPVSSGNGRSYLQKSGARARSLTPTGWYKVQRRIVGVREADLGTLYDPQYFYRGWAIHGSNSVPAYPASHGCVRVTRADAKWLLSRIDVGTSVYLYGGKHTFLAGSSAPGTDAPSGDTDTESPSPAPSRSTAPTPTPSPTRTAMPAPSASASPRPTPSVSPSPSPSSSPS